jgi:hypothetical protein
VLTLTSKKPLSTPVSWQAQKPRPWADDDSYAWRRTKDNEESDKRLERCPFLMASADAASPAPIPSENDPKPTKLEIDAAYAREATTRTQYESAMQRAMTSGNAQAKKQMLQEVNTLKIVWKEARYGLETIVYQLDQTYPNLPDAQIPKQCESVDYLNKNSTVTEKWALSYKLLIIMNGETMPINRAPIRLIYPDKETANSHSSEMGYVVPERRNGQYPIAILLPDLKKSRQEAVPELQVSLPTAPDGTVIELTRDASDLFKAPFEDMKLIISSDGLKPDNDRGVYRKARSGE